MPDPFLSALCLPKLFSLHYIYVGRPHTWVQDSLLSAAHSSSRPPTHTCRYLFNPRDNLLQVEVCMAEGCMPPTMLLVATARAAKAVLKEQPGINNFAKSVQVRGECTQGPGAACSRPSHTHIHTHESCLISCFCPLLAAPCRS